jgi:predicted nicotinamide N-methyase
MDKEYLKAFSSNFYNSETSCRVKMDTYSMIRKMAAVISELSLDELRCLIPETYKEAYSIPHRLRDAYIPFMGFCLLNKKYLDELSNFLKDKKVLEVMAGNGILSTLLKERGVNIISTDIAPGDGNSYELINVFDKDIETLDAVSAIRKYGKDMDYVIMSWPPYDEPYATEVMQAIKEVNDNIIVIYIGETEGGCTADYRFFEMVDLIIDEKFKSVQREYSSWSFIHDMPFLVTNKTE